MKMFCDFFSRESIANFLRNGVVFRPEQFRKFGYAHFPALMLNNAVRAFISLLLLLCCPSAIFLTIPQVVVDPIKRVKVGRTMPHVFEKPLKRCPLWVHVDVTLCVPPRLKGLVAFSARLKIAPATVGAGVTSSTSRPSLPMDGLRYGDLFERTGPATCALSGSQVGSERYGLSATIASAQPSGISSGTVRFGSFKDCPTSEDLSRDVFDVRVKRGSSIWGLAHGDAWVTDSGRSGFRPRGRSCDPILTTSPSKTRRIV